MVLSGRIGEPSEEATRKELSTSRVENAFLREAINRGEAVDLGR